MVFGSLTIKVGIPIKKGNVQSTKTIAGGDSHVVKRGSITKSP